MIYVTEARKEDFTDVYELLKLLNDTRIQRQTWEQVFADVFKSDAAPGYLLKDDDKTVGFFGTIFSNRIIDGKELKFCNCHSWVVDEKYRSKGLLLLNKIHKLKNHILTVFSASGDTYPIYKQLKWKEIDNSGSIFWRRPLISFASDTPQVSKGDKALEGISELAKRIGMDHKAFPSKINSIKKPKGSALQIFKEVSYFPSKLKWLQNIMPLPLKLGQLYYTSDQEFFFSDFKQNMQAICKKEGWIGVIIPNRFLNKHGLNEGKKYYKKRPVLFKTENDIDPSQIDMLYSEVFILDLS